MIDAWSSRGASTLEELVMLGGLVGGILAVLFTSYGTEAALIYVCFAFWRTQVHNNRRNEERSR
ncbi:hypothetical protein [Natrinema sp. SYSU A 869]|uniref:hypothetical protein n=1 Tax=Natrinema sp. SYSU A 869 TaxID=2871694 RepID=UPI001CA3E296|nr:hypothetical protein [Natrinema sp. SYSU A 869]